MSVQSKNAVLKATDSQTFYTSALLPPKEIRQIFFLVNVKIAHPAKTNQLRRARMSLGTKLVLCLTQLTNGSTPCAWLILRTHQQNSSAEHCHSRKDTVISRIYSQLRLSIVLKLFRSGRLFILKPLHGFCRHLQILDMGQSRQKLQQMYGKFFNYRPL